MGDGKRLDPRKFYYREGAVRPVRLLGKFLFKLGIVSNYYIDSQFHGCITGITKQEQEV